MAFRSLAVKPVLGLEAQLAAADREEMPATTVVCIRHEDAALLAEAYRFAQFSDLDLAEPIKAALRRVLDQIEMTQRITHP